MTLVTFSRVIRLTVRESLTAESVVGLMTSKWGEGMAAEEAIEALFHLYADELYRYARYSLPTSMDARDLVQEVFFKAFRAWHAFRHDASPRTWLYGIARNTIIDWLRKQKTERDYQLSHPVSLDDVSVSLDTLVELEDALNQLKPDHRQVFVLRCVQDLNIEDTARILGWSAVKVKTTLHRAIKVLRQTLSEDTVRAARAAGRELDQRLTGISQPVPGLHGERG